jgi:iron complex outermembrane recepter protein
LRGPQGALYGANSMGGLVKYVTIDPSTNGLSGRLQVGTDKVHHGADVGYNVRGAVNIPLMDTLAMRASGFADESPGYIDNTFLNIRGINRETGEGGRLSVLWRPAATLSLKFSALVQHKSKNGSSFIEVGPGLGDLQQNEVRGTGWFRQTVQAYSANVSAKLGDIDLVAVTGYNRNSYSDAFDYTPSFGAYTLSGIPELGFNGFGVTGTPSINYQKTDKFTQEIRLSGRLLENKIDWLMGGFYDHEDSPSEGHILATDPFTGAQVGEWLHNISPTTFSESAVFADLTLHLTDAFDIQVGGRESRDRQNFSTTYVGVYAPVFLGLNSPAVYPKKYSRDNSFTYLLTPRLKLSQNLMIYARLASGFRPGGPNVSFTGGIPSSYAPDKTHNYEAGIKADMLDHRLSVDASVYYIDWKDIQITLIDQATGIGYTGNGSRAKSQGIELSADSKLPFGLSVSGWIALNDAKLTEDLPAASTAYGVSGDRLPSTSRFSGYISLDEDFMIVGDMTGFVGASVSYVGNRQGVFASVYDPAHERQDFPGYAKTDLRAGIRHTSWTTNIYANNLTDKRALLTGGLGTLNPLAFQYIRPREIGVSFARSF